IVHAIKKYIRIGCDLTDGINIETALQNLSGTSIAHIEPNHNKMVDESTLLMDQDNVEI
ncbi:26887_t:CDS:1, partial [Gigaspora margarita]